METHGKGINRLKNEAEQLYGGRSMSDDLPF